MKDLTRRDFLKSIGFIGAAAGAPFGLMQDPVPPEAQPAPQYPITHWDGSPFGRILLNVMTIYKEPNWRSGSVGKSYYFDNVVPIEGVVGGPGLYHTNFTWLKTPDGYIYSSWVQPVTDYPVNPTLEIGEGGAWGQVTVPQTWSRGAPSDDSWRHSRLYFGTVNRVVAAENDYYQVQEIYGAKYWVKAAHMRILAPEELAPINPHVPPEEKRIVISIRDQRLRCYEGETLVAEFMISTGMPSTPTPHGEFSVLDKRIGQRMTGGLGAGAYNLPGIPFVCYFTRRWVATHGCYWHNDYGRLHSNGCVNLLPENAKWVFRWTTPYVNYWDFKTLPNAEAGQPGTKITVGW